MTALPDGWSLVNVATLTGERRENSVIGPFGSNLKVSDYQDKGVPLIFVRNIRAKRFNSAGPHISEAKSVELAAHSVLPGDVLVTKMGEPPGDAALYTGSGPAVLTADCIRIRLSSRFDPRFVAHAFDAPQVRSQFEQITRGVAQRKVSLARFREVLRIPAPNLDEQLRVVQKLEDHLSRLEAARASLDTAARRAELLRWASIAQEVRGARGVAVSLGELAKSVKNGIFISRPGIEPNGVPILRIGAVRPLALDLGDLRYSAKGVEVINAVDGLLSEDDVLFTRYNGNPEYVGACAAVPLKALPLTYPDKLIRVRVDSAVVLPRFLAIACSVGSARAQIRRAVKTTSGQAGISGRDLKATKINLPTIEVQRAVVERCHAISGATAALGAAVGIQQQRAERLRLALLEAAFSGELTRRRSDTQSVEADAQ